MQRTDTIIIGGGQAGLAMSQCLSRRGIDHVVLERGQIGERWRSERWDSLRLLTPNWMTRLPGGGYRGPDPDGFMTRRETIAFLNDYAERISAPLLAETTVEAVDHRLSAFRVTTDRGEWRSRSVVIATGHCDRPFVPGTARRLAPAYRQFVPSSYRSPDQLPNGGVLVVGASATGIQLAEEIHLSGRHVTLAVGRHTRLPRSFGGRDIFWWLDRLGLLDKGVRDLSDLAAARRQPSLQLIGSSDRRDIDLAALAGIGVRIVGRVAGFDGHRAYLKRDLTQSILAAEARLKRISGLIENFAGETFLPHAGPWLPGTEEPQRLDLRQSGIRSVLWATGYSRAYPWLDIPVLDRAGEIIHDEGVCRLPGLCVLGLNFLRRRNSSFIDGVGRDAEALADHLAVHLGAGIRLRAA
jgi:putative flavoprotein involved in K+ transport